MTSANTAVWRSIALEAFDLVFDTNGNKKSINEDSLHSAIDLFYKSISYGANEYWPYIKLADLVTDPSEKIKLYIRAYRVEPNPYSVEYIFRKILEDDPKILDRYL